MLPAEPDGGSRSTLRASDADRDRYVEVLREQCGHGRITLDEFEERVDVVFSARTFAELESVVNDLPVRVPPTAPASYPTERQVPSRARAAARRAGRLLVAILSESSHRGRFLAPPTMTAVAVLGECLIDLTRATFTDGHLVINAFTTLGSIVVLVPDDVHVDLTGLAILAEKSSRLADVEPAADAPVVTVRALAVLAEVEVRTLNKKERIKREQRARAS
jgi:hypothetical protein